MSYRVPTFNLLCNLYSSNNHAGAPRVANVPCNLTPGRRVFTLSTGGTSSRGTIVTDMHLLIPAATDIRGPLSSTGTDAVECPAGSGRYYTVDYVDDAAKGFGNEYRFAVMFATAQPTPLV